MPLHRLFCPFMSNGLSCKDVMCLTVWRLCSSPYCHTIWNTFLSNLSCGSKILQKNLKSLTSSNSSFCRCILKFEPTKHIYIYIYIYYYVFFFQCKMLMLQPLMDIIHVWSFYRKENVTQSFAFSFRNSPLTRCTGNGCNEVTLKMLLKQRGLNNNKLCECNSFFKYKKIHGYKKCQKCSKPWHLAKYVLHLLILNVQPHREVLNNWIILLQLLNAAMSHVFHLNPFRNNVLHSDVSFALRLTKRQLKFNKDSAVGRLPATLSCV